MAASSDKDNFRMRRLSISDNQAKNADAKTPTPARPARARRMSMSPEMGAAKKMEDLPFPLEKVGTYSCHGVEPGNRQGETNAKINQDRGCVVYPFAEPEKAIFKQALFCVFDGHGACGDKVSNFSMLKLHERLEAKLRERDDGGDEDYVQEKLKECFVYVDEEMRKNTQIDAELSGTTAVACVCRQYASTPDQVHLFMANAGDSRAILGTKPGTASGELACEDLTIDQKPDTPAEMRRIKKKGGFVSPPEEDWGGPARVWLDATQTLPGLAMARSIGDHLVKSIGVIAEPEVSAKVCPMENTFMVMASDGVWEFLESMDAAKLVNDSIWQSSTDACTKLIETAALKWRVEEGDYRDDITAICVRFNSLFEAGR
eukprot:CAMPEP_0183331030 /NCGR_PEP_ID=MMETSP0164_2-20130417/441_1 /TAXON_ID=221442 /ORGANISM="Coccolithus pelagicus ssp braarudi, Strain PLY182g" /LENGTH=373 /DNA_ID=CAMNT_0025499389 /DNA_START=48 /DNA_END=1169 /DNA_ORIENTATION=-